MLYLCNAALATIAAALLGLMFGCMLALNLSHARDLGQWDNADPAVRLWYERLKQPDDPAVSCCGSGDAYWTDSYEVQGDHYVAIVTDDRPDAPLRRQHVPPGTRIVVPNNKLKFDEGNPTGHGVIFFQPGNLYVWCYVAPGGV